MNTPKAAPQKEPKNTKWSKKIFSLLLVQAKGVRSWRQYASDCGVSYVQLRKLAMGMQENPPRPKLIQKLAANAFGDIDAQDFMYAAGINVFEMKLKLPDPSGESFTERFRALPARHRKTVEEFVDFLRQKK